MPGIAVAAPYIASAVGTYFASRGSGSESNPSAGELAATSSQGQAANTLLGNASRLSATGAGALDQSTGYFSKLAGGNRATLTQALAPEIEGTNAVYGGTARTLSRFLRGPQRDVQLAESERERGGAIGKLFQTARPAANSALAGIGTSAFGGANAAAGGAGGLFGSQAALGMQSRFGGAELSRQTGQDFGGLLFNLLKAYSGRGAGRTGGFPTGGGGGSSQPGFDTGFG